MITVRRFLASSLLVFLSLTMVHAQDALSSAAPASTPPNSDHSDAKASATGAMSIAPAVVPPEALAAQLFRSGNYPAAAEQYKAILKTNVGDAAASAGLARVYLAQGKVAEALVAATKAVESAPALATGRTTLGDVYLRQGKLSDAEREYLTPVRAGIVDARAYYGLARISWMTSSSKRAKRMIDKAHELDPNDPEIFLSWVYTLDLPERAKQVTARLASDLPMGGEERKSLKFIEQLLDAENQQPNTTCRLVTKPAATQITLERLMLDPTHYRGFGLVVRVNGTASKLMLDTGASGILVNSRIAQKAGVQRIADRPIGGIGDKGAADGYIGYADSIKVGDLEFQNCLIDVVDKKRSLGEDGLIGADVFQSFLVDIDFPNEELKLSELPTPPGENVGEATPESSLSTKRYLHDRYVAPEMKDYERVFRSGHDLLISTYVNKMVPRLFLIDTGSYDNLLSTNVAREYTKVHSDDSVIKGLNGKVNDVYTADKVRIAFGHFMQDGEDVTAFDLTGISEDSGTEVSGILGFCLLWELDMKIDYRDSLVNFSYDAKRMR